MNTNDENNCKKLFLGGLSSTSTEESLRTYFTKFGEVQETQIMVDRATGELTVGRQRADSVRDV